jgi:hypothetical protein
VSAAYSTGTNKACDIKRASDSTTQTFNILNTGNFDTAGAATFCAATTCNVTRQYNQVAASFPDLVQTGAGLIPLLSFNCINTTLPCVNFYTGGSGQRYMASANPASGDAQPTTIGGAYSDNALASIDVFVSHGFGIFGTGTNSRHLFAGAASGNFTSTDNTVHAVSVVFNGASSSANVDGVLTSSLNAGTTFGFADPAGPIQISDSSSTVGIGYEGEFFEATGAMSSGDRAAYRTSAQDYYATP